MFSTASCTTHCVAPIVEILDRRLGVEKAMMTAVDAHSSLQPVVDGPQKKLRRGRAGAANYIPCPSRSTRITMNVLPKFEGKFDGIAIHGPVPMGSLADVVLLTQKRTGVEAVNQIFREESGSERYRDILGVSEVPLVSSDIIGDPRPSVVDLTLTKVVDGTLVKIISWYDKEWGHAAQMVREAINLRCLV
jgi:glyceraldehyde 3-phosphate dehydrogenase